MKKLFLHILLFLDFDEMLETDPGNITDAQTVYGIESARRKFSISGKDINHAETLWDLEIEKEMAESQGKGLNNRRQVLRNSNFIIN